VRNDAGPDCGTIIWEMKRTRNWQKSWIAKLKEDQREHHAEIAVLLSLALPPEVRNFAPMDGVWVTDFGCAIGLASALRQGLLSLAGARRAETGKREKAQVLYSYLSSTEFRQRIEAVVEAFVAMKADLDAEKRATARLTLREGATPLRSLGRVSIRPRTYQFVPLLMALRLDPIRMLIADDVGVGKTAEGLLISRELYDRGEIKRLCVLCPPYLCEQWQKELNEKFDLDAVLIRSGTVNQLERRIPAGGGSIFSYYPVQVISIDFVKGDRKRANFLQHCPNFVIVDEAHGAASASTTNANQQQRHELLRDLAASPTRHLVLLTATPHSGVPEAFCSLLALLRDDFATYEVSQLSEPQRIQLARHFVQRTRNDIEKDWEAEHCFPRRDPSDEHYRLSEQYSDLFQRTYDFCTELVRTGQSLDKRKQRVCYWAALALLRCVMSSPGAAIAALDRRDVCSAGFSLSEQPKGWTTNEDEIEFSANVFESSNEQTDDSQPTPPVESAEQTLPETERRAKIEELAQERRRVLVATDCLSEGINLQNAFNAAIHYDLPWNPNRLEQREGRVDRFGQTLSKTVKTIRYFSPDNAVDGVVIRVLLNKAREIHQALGTHVPVPEESETVTQAVLNALFFRGRATLEPVPQMELGLELPEVQNLHRRWDLDAAREKENRTPLLAEEVQLVGHTGTPDKPAWLDQSQVLELLEKAHADANIRDEEKRELATAALAGYEKLDTALRQTFQTRAEALTDAHRRIRQAVSLKVRGLTVQPQMPPDLLGLLVLQPFVNPS
jgi:superfamily II DNA or RNA helicase